MNTFERLTQNAKEETVLLRKIEEIGDVFTKAPEVDFAFEATERKRAKDFAEFVNGKNYGSAEVSKVESSLYRFVVLVTMPITQQLICTVSGFMQCLSRLFLIDFQRWGSVIQPD